MTYVGFTIYDSLLFEQRKKIHDLLQIVQISYRQVIVDGKCQGMPKIIPSFSKRIMIKVMTLKDHSRLTIHDRFLNLTFHEDQKLRCALHRLCSIVRPIRQPHAYVSRLLIERYDVFYI